MIIDLRFMRPYWKCIGLLGLYSTPTAHAYTPGLVRQKAQPIIDLLREAAEPIAYGMYIWSGIKFIMGRKADARETFKGTTYGLVGIKMLPWFFDPR